MSKNVFVLRHLSIAVLGMMASSAVLAQSEPLATLEREVIILDRQGTKVQSNVVTLQEKDESTEKDLRGLLKDEPAIDFAGGTGSSQFLTLRGMGQNSVDIKVDNAYSDSQMLYHQGRFILDPSLVKIVSVQKGAGSASAGIGATNGAIIARTVDAQDLLAKSDKDYGAKLSFDYSSNDSKAYGATVFGRAGNFDALFSYNFKDQNNYKAGNGYANGLNGGNYVPYSALDTTSYLAKVGANFGDHRVVLSHLQDKQAGVRTVREEFTVFDDNPRLTAKRQAPTYRETSLSNTNLEWTADNLGVLGGLTANAYQMKNKRYSADDTNCTYCGKIEGPTTTVIETKGANIGFDKDIGQDMLVKYGVNYRQQEITPHKFLAQQTVVNKPEKTDMGVYIEAIKDIHNFTLTAGLRYDRFDFKAVDGRTASDSQVNPSIGVIWQATPALSLSANHNYASRSPRLYDALRAHSKYDCTGTPQVCGDAITSIADGTVAERAKNTEIGFNYKYGNATFDGSYFWQKIDDVVVNPQARHDAQGNPIGRTQEAKNDGYAKNYGYELGASYKKDAITARIGVSESKPTFYLNTPASSLSQEFAVRAGRTWTGSVAYRFDNPNVELGWRGRLVEDVEASALANAAPVKRDGYFVNDVFVNWKPYDSDKMNVNFAINNLADTLYYPHSQRGETLPGVGREFRVGVNYQF